MNNTVFSPADASANSAPGGRTTRHKRQIVSLAPGAPQLLDVQAVAELLGCSTRHIYRLSDSGRMPAPVKLGSLVRWRATGPCSIAEWVDQGCPAVRRAGR